MLAGAVPSAKPCPPGAVPVGRATKADKSNLLDSVCGNEEEDNDVFDNEAPCGEAGASGMGNIPRLANDHAGLAKFCVVVLSVLINEDGALAPEKPTSE